MLDATTCDGCDKPVTGPLMYVRLQRPSDPSDMCCVMWGCAKCFPYSKNSCMTGDQWEDYIESPEAAAKGHIFLT